MASSDSTLTELEREYFSDPEIRAGAIASNLINAAKQRTAASRAKSVAVKRALEQAALHCETRAAALQSLSCTCTQRLYGVNHGINCPLRIHIPEEA